MDATIGWALSWMIGPGQVQGLADNPLAIGIVIVIVIITAAVLGLVGGVVAKVTG